VLELLLCYAIPQRNVNPLAHELLAHFGSLHGVLRPRRKNWNWWKESAHMPRPFCT
jgi:DNA repair protein RadC